MDVGRKAVRGVAALVGLWVVGGTAHALTTVTVDKCLSAQIKIVGKGAAATTACHAKAAEKDLVVDSTCLDKAAAKIAHGFDKLDEKQVCIVEGSSGTRTTNNASFGALIDSTVGHAPGKCDAAKTKRVGKYVAAVSNCYANAAAKTGTVEAECVTKALEKLTAAIAKAEERSDCSNVAQTPFLTNVAGSFLESETCALEPGAPGCVQCGNGLNDPFEPCDASAPSAGWAQCGPEFTCTDCNCACPTTLVLSSDATAPESRIDYGWTGVGHATPFPSNGDLTVQLSSCAGTNRPCGTCDVSGPIANPQAGAGQLDSQRCTTNSAKKCTSDAVCAARTCLGGTNDGASCSVDSECPSGGSCPPAGLCNFYVGSSLPLAAGGLTDAHCVQTQFEGPIFGTFNVESGEMGMNVLARARLYSGISIDQPCPRCTDAGGFNDGVNGGTCDGGPRVGRPCDANGFIPDRPDFGFTSLDCPPLPGALLANLPIDLSNVTAPATKTLTVGSPNCSGSFGDKCLCGTCNNGSNTSCFVNADCPDPAGPIGPICNGTRCLGGPNAGAACTVASQCPSSSCSRPGEPTKPSPCIDDTSVEDRDLECADGDGDGEGVCTLGPLDQTCTIASGHAQRTCVEDSGCGGGFGSCGAANRKCFPTGGGTFQPSGQNDGTDTLVAIGMEDPPTGDVANPTLGSVLCVSPTFSGAFNNVNGLPGPARVISRVTAVAHP